MVEDLCEYVNANWDKSSAIHLAAYVMWRLNWIHPFADGNGRTSRIVSYVVLSIRSGYEIPGTNTIPDQIEADRTPYFNALEAADAAWKRSGIIDVGEMESVLSNCLAAQFISAIRDAGGTANDV